MVLRDTLQIADNLIDLRRGGGVVDRARLEIVLRRNTYGGSNPLLCAKKRHPLNGCLFFGVVRWLLEIRRVRASVATLCRGVPVSGFR